MPRPIKPVESFDRIPVNRFLGYTLTERGDGTACVTMPARREYAQEAGVIQGGLLTALADTAAAYALLPAEDDGTTIIGTELKVNFLRAATAGGDELRARSQVLKRGRTVSVVEAEVCQGAQTVLKGSFGFLHYRAGD